MVEYTDGFGKDFVMRTMNILDDLQDKRSFPYEVTLLLNCALALLCLPVQLIEEKPCETVRFSESCINKLEMLGVSIEKGSINPDTNNGRTKDQQIMCYMRNGVAHLHIKLNNGIGIPEIETITIWNVSNNGVRNFEITFTVKQLNNFLKFVAHEFLKNGLNELLANNT